MKPPPGMAWHVLKALWVVFLFPGMGCWPAHFLCLQDSVQLVDGAQLSLQQDGTTYSLVLRNVAQQDAGVYTCVAQNAGGQVLCKAELLVHGGESGDPSQAPSRLHADVASCGLPEAAAQGAAPAGNTKWGHGDGWPSLSTPTAGRSLTVGESEPDLEKQSYRRKLHSFYDVKEEIGRYLPLTPPPELRLPGVSTTWSPQGP